MAKLNENFFNLKKNYLFIDIGKRVKAYTAAHPEAKLIRMGIGDVTQPLAPAVVDAMVKASKEMGVKETFRGYEDSGAGYDFLREAVSPPLSTSATAQRATAATSSTSSARATPL